MNKTLLLTKIMLGSSSIFSSTSNPNPKRKPLTQTQKFILMALVMVASFGFIGVSFGFLAYSIVLNLKQFEMQNAVIQIIMPIGNLAIVIISIFSVISTFFLSSDNAELLPLPLKPREILLARFIVTLLNSYLIVGMFIAPLFIGYGIAMQANVLFYLICIINILVIPIIPLSIILLLSVISFQRVNLTKYKDLLTYFFVFVILAISFGANFFFREAFTITETDPAAVIQAFKMLLDSFLTKLTFFMPNAYLAIKSLTAALPYQQILYTLACVVLSLGVLAIVVAICSPLYFKTIKGSDERNTNKKKIDENTLLAKSTTKSTFKSSVITEWRLLVRSPTYFMNLVAAAFLMPIIVFITFFMAVNEGETQGFEELIVAMQSSNFVVSKPLGFLVFFGILLFFSSMVMVSSSAISRMGRSADYVKYIPVSTLQIVNIKAFWGIFISILTSLIILIGLAIMGVINILDLVVLFIVSIPTFVLFNYLAIHIDTKRPKLEWLNETQAVKQNTNSLIYVFGSWIIAIAFVGIGIAFINVSIPYIGYVVGLIITIITTLLDLLYIRYVKKHENDYFNHIA